MPKFSERSVNHLLSCHKDLQDIFLTAIQSYDCTVIEGYRNKADQIKMKRDGKSQLTWPNSKHNKKPSLAVDVVPYPIEWDNIERFKTFCWFIKGIAAAKNIKILSGGLDWDNFKDYPHFELEE